MKIMPAWKHPTTIVILDDCHSFLKSIELILPKKNHKFLFFTNPDEAIEAINDTDISTKTRFPCAKIDGEFKPDLLNIPQISTIKNRSCEISTIIVDYHMPKINGIEFCKKIKNNSIQKILLTANYNEQIAIKAFNNKIIHKYFRKQDKTIDDNLRLSIKNSENNYFKIKSNIIISQIKLNNNFFCNKNLQNFLKDFIKKEHVLEYYIFDKNGSFFCLHSDGSTSQVFIKSKQDINVPLTWAEADYVSQKTINDIKEYKKMLCIPADFTDFQSADQWDKYIHITTQFPNEPDYFFAIVKNKKLHNN